RVIMLEPPQGSSYRTEYQYNANGSLAIATIYDSGTGADTTYTYDTTTGQLLTRDFPTVSTHWIRTGYAYDSAGRLQYETVTKENGGHGGPYKTQYRHPVPSGQEGGEGQRAEQALKPGWVNGNRLTDRADSLGRLQYEEREDWNGSSWVSKYNITQGYDKN